MIRRLRLASGLVMFAYVTTHFVNHSLGLVSVQVMDRALEHIYQYWASLLGSVLLYGAFATHYSLALWALWLRRSLKMPFAEATQLILGFSIPFFLTDHVLQTRVADLQAALSGHTAAQTQGDMPHQDFCGASVRLLLDRTFDRRKGGGTNGGHFNDLFDYAGSKRLSEREKAALHYADLLKQGEHSIDKDEVYADLASTSVMKRSSSSGCFSLLGGVNWKKIGAPFGQQGV